MPRLRSVVVLITGAYVVHTLRYVLAYGGHARSELVAEGHGYLAAAPVVLTLLVAVSAAALVLRVAYGGDREEPRLSRVWAVSTAALMAIFAVQELAEGWLAQGHPEGLAAVAAHGGWLAAPLSAAVGLVVALLHRGAAAVLAAARGRVPRPALRAEAVVVWCPASAQVSRVPGPWLGGRGPPALAG